MSLSSTSSNNPAFQPTNTVMSSLDQIGNLFEEMEINMTRQQKDYWHYLKHSIIKANIHSSAATAKQKMTNVETARNSSKTEMEKLKADTKKVIASVKPEDICDKGKESEMRQKHYEILETMMRNADIEGAISNVREDCNELSNELTELIVDYEQNIAKLRREFACKLKLVESKKKLILLRGTKNE